MWTWIPVSTSEVDSPTVARLRAALTVSAVEALGHLVALQGRLAEHQPDGRLADLDNELLEQWARWGGERGLFAAAVRELLIAPDGCLVGWTEKVGRFISRFERERERKRNARARNGRGQSPDVPSPTSAERR